MIIKNMKNRIFISELGGKRAAIEKCKELILNEIRSERDGLLKEWDGELCERDINQHFEDIVQWCRDNIKSTIWSSQKSTKYTWNTSYGAKHRCEYILKRYVSNNWMKMAMICAGFDVCTTSCVDYETGYVCKAPIKISDIFDNGVNFIVRRPTKRIDIDDIICDWTYEIEGLK